MEAMDQYFKEQKIKYQNKRIKFAKSKEQDLRRIYGNQVDENGFYQRPDVIHFIMTSEFFNMKNYSNSSSSGRTGNSNNREDNDDCSHSSNNYSSNSCSNSD